MITVPVCVEAQQLAFPGAEGFGKYATGGRTGTVYHVTNLNDSGSGSFRDAVSKPNRIVVFDVAGVIRINSRVAVSKNIYIAGQTAPGEGITIYGNGLSFSNADNTICRYLRVRMGIVGESGADALGISSGSNMIFDHCSVAWGRDETFSISGDNPQNITIQNCIISQGLLGHSAGGLIQTGGGVTIYRTLYIHNDTRNPKFKGVHQYVNNIVYNWNTAAYIMGGESEGKSYANATSNLFITGPTGRKNAFSGANANYNIYEDDNYIDDDKNGKMELRRIQRSEFSGGPTFQNVPYDYPSLPAVKATDLYDDLTQGVGASLPYRDNLDWLLLNDLHSAGFEGSIISDERTLDIGAPDTWSIWKGEKPADTDGDGMPDWWENANGTDVAKNDAMTIGSDGYANIERYINSITKEQSQYFLKAPISLRAGNKIEHNFVTFKWRDVTDHEQGYSVEQLIDGSYIEVARLEANINEWFIEGLQPNTSYSFRVRAFDANGYSGYSNVLTLTTKGKAANIIDPADYNADLTWTGSASNLWNTTDANWTNSLGNSVVYDNNAKVLFTDNGSGTITIPSAVSPWAVMVNSDNDYTISGVIGECSKVYTSDNTQLIKAGKGTLKLTGANSFKGSTIVSDGTLEVAVVGNSGTANPMGTASSWVLNGGKMLYTGSSASTNRELSILRPSEIGIDKSGSTLTMNSAITGEGDLTKSGSGTLSIPLGMFNTTGNVYVKEGTLTITGKDALGTNPQMNGTLHLQGGRFRIKGGDNAAEGQVHFPIVVNGENTSYLHIGQRNNIYSNVSGTGNLVLEVEYLREYYKGDWSRFYGHVTAKQTGSSGNQFYLDNAGYGGMPYATLDLQGSLEMRAGASGKTYSIGALTGASSTTLACCFIKKDGGTAVWRIGGLGTDATFNGKITNGIEHSSRIGHTSIVKEGEGYWRVNGNCKYRGTTTIEGGMLIMNGTHSKDKDYTGTYFTPGNYTVKSGATLSGKGTTEAAVVVENGGTIAPGDFGIGTFTSNNSITMKDGATLNIEVNRKNKTSDRLTTKSTLTAAGTLNITLIDGNFAEGDSFYALAAQTFKGAFSEILPATPGEGLIWDTSRLLITGQLMVKADPTGIYSPASSATGPCVITTLQGVVVKRLANWQAEATSDIPAGIYIVTQGGKSWKVKL